MKNMDIVINAIGPTKALNEEHTRLIDKVVNEMLV